MAGPGFKEPLTPPPPAPSQPEEPPEATDELQTEPTGLRGRVERLRQLASGRRRPFGSTEGRRHQPRGMTRRSWASSETAAFTDLVALGLRETTRQLDYGLGERTGRDLVMTADECYRIAGPLAGVLLERAPEGGLVEQVVERAGEGGAVIGLAGYLLRVLRRRPGGAVEAEELHEEVVQRLVHERKDRRGARFAGRIFGLGGERPGDEGGQEAAEPEAPQARLRRLAGVPEPTSLEDVGPV